MNYAALDSIHDFGPTGDHGDGSTATQGLGEYGEIGRYTIMLLGPAHRQTKTGHHFVEDQDDAMPVALLAECSEVALVRFNYAGVARYRFQNYRGEPIAVLSHRGLKHRQVVEGPYKNVVLSRTCLT
jgi:hypothetical protein